MLVQFVTDHHGAYFGFSAKIYNIPINSICKDWLDTTTRFLISAEYPTMDCSWVITAPMGSTISIQFQVFEVKIVSTISTYLYLCPFFHSPIFEFSPNLWACRLMVEVPYGYMMVEVMKIIG